MKSIDVTRVVPAGESPDLLMLQPCHYVTTCHYSLSCVKEMSPAAV